MSYQSTLFYCILHTIWLSDVYALVWFLLFITVGVSFIKGD